MYKRFTDNGTCKGEASWRESARPHRLRRECYIGVAGATTESVESLLNHILSLRVCHFHVMEIVPSELKVTGSQTSRESTWFSGFQMSNIAMYSSSDFLRM